MGDVTKITDERFSAIGPNPFHIYDAVRIQRVNASRVCANTKTKAQVSGSGVKLFKQKGTGRARQGEGRNPHMEGGGVVFGPHPRRPHIRINRRVVKSALLSALAHQMGQGALYLVEDNLSSFTKAKQIRQLMDSCDLWGTGLVVTEAGVPLVLAARNLKWLKIVTADKLNVPDILGSDFILFSRDAWRQVERKFFGA
jgi:large subunit ribosomal protein L4